MKNLFLFLALLLGLSSQAANFYVRPGGAGSQNGTDWNNAWNIASINWSGKTAGDTIWLAGGAYPSALTFGASGTSLGQLTVRKVCAGDAVPAAAAGFNTLFTNVATIPPTISLNQQSYVTLDGGVDDGIQITQNGATYVVTMNQYGTSPATDERILHVTIFGDHVGGINPGGSSSGTGIDFGASSTAYNTNFYVGHCRIDGMCEGIKVVNDINATVEYTSILHCVGNNSPQHVDFIYFYGFSNFTIRYCYFYDLTVDGIFWGDMGTPFVGFKFYGNVCIAGPNTGVNAAALWMNESYGTVGYEVYNNTFVGWPYGAISSPSGGTLNFACSNNIFWNCVNNVAGGDYNYYNASGFENGGAEAHSVVNAANPFVNNVTSTTNGNWRLLAGSAPVNAGVALANPAYNTDPDGNTRGAGGGWDIGAYELGGAPSTNPVILVTPSAVSFGYLLTNTSSTNSFTVQNVGAGTLTGSVSFGGFGYSILSGASYSLTNGQSQSLVLRFNPTSVGQFSPTLTFTGGGGATAQANGVGMEAFAVNKIFTATNGYITQPFSLTSTGAVFQVSEIDNPTNSGQAQYWVEIPSTGNYEVNGYIQAPNGGANSSYITFDTPNVEPNTIWDVATNSAFAWTLANNRGTGTFDADQFIPMIWNLSAGPHQLLVGGREANTYLGAWQVVAAGAGPPAPNGLRIARVTYP